MSKTLHPKLIIIDYYDMLIRHVDIYTEEVLAKYQDNEKQQQNETISKNENKNKRKNTDSTILDPKKKKTKLDENNTPEKDVSKLLNEKRDELIGRLRKCQGEILAYYETIKNELKVIGKSASEEEIRARLFENKFAFLLIEIRPEINVANTSSPFQLYLVELDFYLSKHEKALLKCLFETKSCFKDPLEPDFDKKVETVLNQEFILVYIVNNYINSHNNLMNNVISINLKELKKITHLSLNFYGEVIIKNINLNLENNSVDRKHDFSYNIQNLTMTFYSLNKHKLLDVIGFDGLKNLKDLRFDSCLTNQEFKLFDATFSRLNFLKSIYINLGDFQEMTNKGFQCVRNLESLTFLKPKNNSHLTFANLPRLKSINFNRIEWQSLQLDSQLCLDDLHLTSCSINRENIIPLASKLSPLNLQKMYLCYNYFKHFDCNWLSEILNLQSLAIDASSIETIKFSKNMSSLRSLSLARNKLKSIDPSISFLSKLESLDLSGNLFKPKANMFESISTVKHLKLSENKGLTKICKNMFRSLENLISLSISICNELTEIDNDAFSDLPRLKSLVLSYNRLKLENTDVFRHLTQLEELSLCDNLLEHSSIEKGLFLPLKNLEYLNINKNRISKITSNMFRGLLKLKRLDMSSNVLEYMELEALSCLPCLNNIILTTSDKTKQDEFKIFFQSKIQFN